MLPESQFWARGGCDRAGQVVLVRKDAQSICCGGESKLCVRMRESELCGGVQKGCSR